MTEHIDEISADFIARLTGVLEKEKIASIVESLKQQSALQAIPASGGIQSFVFYLRFGLVINPGPFQGPWFTGQAGGLAVPGGGNLNGSVYTDDTQRLYANTVSFEFNAAIVYTSLLFFDASSNLLGHFQGTSTFSTVLGVGGGTGSWSSTPEEDSVA